MGRIALILVVVPILELLILLRLGDMIGLLPTLLVVVVTGIAGAALAHRQGLRTLARIRAELAAGRPPVGHLVDGLLILCAGALLLTPGVLTDLLGLALLVPGSRAVFKRLAARGLARLAAHGRIDVTVYRDL